MLTIVSWAADIFIGSLFTYAIYKSIKLTIKEAKVEKLNRSFYNELQK